MRLRDLCKAILTNDGAGQAVRQGHPARFQAVPAHKRLCNAPPGQGIPIGDLTSQFFANVYLNELDQFVKHQLRCRHYLRYVDDFVLLHENPAQLAEWRDAIRRFLAEQLNLALRDDGRLRPVGDGADFLGYIIRPRYRLCRRRVVEHLRQRLQYYQARMVKPGLHGETLAISEPHHDALRASLASYLGHCKHANSWRLQQSLWRRYPYLREMFELTGFGQITPLWEAPAAQSLRQQWRYFKQRYPQSLVLVQTGRHVEAYEQDAEVLAAQGYRLSAGSRASFQQAFSVPLAQCRSLRAKLRRGRIAHVFIAEQGYHVNGLKRRVLRLRWRPYPEPLVPTRCVTAVKLSDEEWHWSVLTFGKGAPPGSAGILPARFAHKRCLHRG